MPELNAVDLNLIGPLDALLRERHVSRAADALNMSQPAMSRALRGLREALDDELLVRSSPGGYRLTPRAERLQRELEVTLPQLRSLFSEEAYDPRQAALTFQLAGTDYILNVLVPTLVANATAASPASTLHFDGLSEDFYRDVERGIVDLALAGPFAPPPLRSEVLFHDDYLCVISADHPLAGRTDLALDDYLAHRHAVVDIVGGRQGAIDRHLDALGRPRHTGVVVPFHALAGAAVAHTDLIATLPRRIVGPLTADPALTAIPSPPEIEGMDFVMTWHPRLDGDPAQRWLREIVRRTARELTASQS